MEQHMSDKDDQADYAIDPPRPGRPQPDLRPPSMLRPVTFRLGSDEDDMQAPAGPGDSEPDDAELLTDLPPMPPKPEGPPPSEKDLRRADESAVRDDVDADEPPDLEALYNLAKGIMPEHDQMIETMAAIHARWRKAWQDTDAFSDEEAFELVRILVASSAGAIRALD
jgi:hypothetical protein